MLSFHLTISPSVIWLLSMLLGSSLPCISISSSFGRVVFQVQVLVLVWWLDIALLISPSAFALLQRGPFSLATV